MVNIHYGLLDKDKNGHDYSIAEGHYSAPFLPEDDDILFKNTIAELRKKIARNSPPYFDNGDAILKISLRSQPFGSLAEHKRFRVDASLAQLKFAEA